MAAMRDRDALVAWALAALKGGAQHQLLRRRLDKRPSSLAQRFGLDALERRIVELAYAVERSLAVAETARARGGLTVERLRALLGNEVDAALSPRRALRRHALVTVAARGMAAASELVRLAPGLAARLDGAAEPEGLWMGILRLLPGGRGDVPATVAALLGDVDAAAPTLLTLDGCPRRESHELALGLARRLGRGVLLLDGELAADAPDAALLLACARREADCEGDALVVCEAAALGERWRALLAPAVAAAPLVVLSDGQRTRDPVAATPFVVRRLSLHARAAAAPTPPATADALRDEPAAPVDDGLGHVRQMAIRDAERALGIFRPPPPPLRASASTATAAPTRPPFATPNRSTGAPTSAAATPTSAAATPTSAAATPTASAGAPPKKRSAKGAQYFGGEAAPGVEPRRAGTAAGSDRDFASDTGVAGAAVADADGAPLVRADTDTDAVPRAVATPDGAPLAVADNASSEELARAATTSPSPAQRIELIARIRGIKSAAVVAALRANAASAHPGVRAAAEAAMSSLFGANWNVARPVAKPVQPPRAHGDDKDRGPPGGW